MRSAPHPGWIVPDWPAAKRVCALATTRAGGSSAGPFATLNLSLRVGDDFAVCEWTARTGNREWDGVDVFPLEDGLIARKDVYSSSHRAREVAS